MGEEISVMLVDDEPDFLEILVKRLRKRKVSPIAVGSGQAAVAAIREATVDVVVLDMRMEGMDGIETLRELKRLRPEVEVIMLTGHANVEAAIQGMELGAFDYLVKPVDIDELLFRLQDAARRKSLLEQGKRIDSSA